MVRPWIWLVAPLLAAACTPATPASPCGRMCRELVQNCGYAAYPTFDSCLQGCGYNESEGADIDGQEACVAAAECDTFAIVECEHAYND
jgi:hypothetical protein